METLSANCDLIVAPNKISISALDKAKVLQALFKKALPPGLAFLQPADEEDDDNLDLTDIDESGLSYIEAKELIKSGQTYFDYLKARPMKIDLSGGILDTTHYNYEHGENAAEHAICEFFHNSLHIQQMQPIGACGELSTGALFP